MHVIDTGCDVTSCYFSDPSGRSVPPSDAYNPKSDQSFRKVVQYCYCFNGLCGDSHDDVNGHGTHVSGTAIGSILGVDISASM